MAGRACLACLPAPPNLKRELVIRKLEYLCSSLNLDERSLPLQVTKKLYALFYKIQQPLAARTRSPLNKKLDMKGANLPQQAHAYQFRRQEIVSLIDRYVDVALSVSDRSASVYRQYGVNPARLSTQYIGSKAAQFPVPSQNPATYSPEQPFRCVYMGVPRKDKGFYFLLEELRCLPEAELRTLELVVASKIIDRTELELAMQQKGQLLSLAQSLHRLIYHPGYAYDNIPDILDGAHLGIVPPLWEDNLPQVTFELLACRVPVLCSNRGGAQEFVRHPAFIFDPAKKGDFQQKLLTIRQNPHLLAEFWQEAQAVRSLEQHFQALIEVYTSCGTGG
jgi:glycosyltransferase involved in cell wall biosynthesis